MVFAEDKENSAPWGWFVGIAPSRCGVFILVWLSARFKCLAADVAVVAADVDSGCVNSAVSGNQTPEVWNTAEFFFMPVGWLVW